MELEARYICIDRDLTKKAELCVILLHKAVPGKPKIGMEQNVKISIRKEMNWRKKKKMDGKKKHSTNLSVVPKTDPTLFSNAFVYLIIEYQFIELQNWL